MDYLTTHASIVSDAARAYIDQLRKVSSEVKPTGRLGLAVDHLITTHEAALKMGPRLTPGDVPFNRSDLSGLAVWQQLALLDQHVLGVGNDGAGAIFMGTEEAYNPGDGGDLAIGCSLSALWLCGSRVDVLESIDPHTALKADQPRTRQYHIHPNDFYRVDNGAGRHTWKCIARILQPADPGSLLVPPADNQERSSLGSLSYQIEVSAFPSSVASGGQPPTRERIAFLERLASIMRSTAKALVFHGGPPGDRASIASAFLDRPVAWKTHDENRAWYSWDGDGDRAVFHTYSLSGRVRDSYLDMLRARILELAPLAIPRSG